MRWEAGVILVGVSQDPGPRAGTQVWGDALVRFAFCWQEVLCVWEGGSAMWEEQRLRALRWGHSYRGYKDSGHLMDHGLICRHGGQWAAVTAPALARPEAKMRS